MAFSKLLQAKRDLLQRKSEKSESFGRYLDEKAKRLFQDWLKTQPKKGKSKLRVKDCPEVAALTEKYNQRKVFVNFWKMWRKKEEKLDSLIYQMAQGLTPRKTDTKSLFARISSYNWSTQGYGAARYARNAVDRNLSEIEANGISGLAEKDEDNDFPSWNVYAYTDEEGIEIIKNKPIPLAKIVHGYWSRGANPRVDMPYLPYGYEESVGLRYGQIVNEELFDKACQKSI